VVNARNRYCGKQAKEYKGERNKKQPTAQDRILKYKEKS
jgi:hypothetical protein